MSKPVILTVDDDPLVSAAIARDLRSRYGADYRIVRATSGAETLTVLTKLALRGQPVALIAADQRMPEMTGIELLARALPRYWQRVATRLGQTDVGRRDPEHVTELPQPVGVARYGSLTSGDRRAVQQLAGDGVRRAR